MTREEIIFLRDTFSYWYDQFQLNLYAFPLNYFNPPEREEYCAAEQLEAEWRGLA